MSFAQLVRRALSSEPVTFNNESWLVVSVGPCPGDACPQQLLGSVCAGIVGLVNAHDSRFTVDHLHARVGEVAW